MATDRLIKRSGSDIYRSPSRCTLVKHLENKFLSADESGWTGRRPMRLRVVAEVPLAVYLNFLVRKSSVAELAPQVFRPLDLPGDEDSALFTILVFALERARPMRAPGIVGALAPRIMQSNWRFYGHLRLSQAAPQSAVLFTRTVTTSLVLSAFGRRLARCFPLRRARNMALGWDGTSLTALMDPGGGSAPRLEFKAERVDSAKVHDAFGEEFPTYESYARWVIDQHLSLTIWPREYIVQDMHLDFQHARITPLNSLETNISGLDDIMPNGTKPFDCFVVERLSVFLDDISAFEADTGGHESAG